MRCPGCGASFAPGPYPGTISLGALEPNFAQRLDADVFEQLVPALDRLQAPANAELEIMRHAEHAGIEIGNPVYEGRADVPRLLVERGGVVLDFGCGFGTNSIALARDARHVFALDRAPARVALTAARARAEGLENITAIHASGLDLPLADAFCDAVLLIGVLEWTGVGSGSPRAAQARALAEAARVLRPGGLLVVAIENRFSATYLTGIAEEHTNLPFISLLPRALGRPYHRLARGSAYEALTHSRRELGRMLSASGLNVNIGYVAPSYQHPQLTFDGRVGSRAKRYYLRHVFHSISNERRLAGRLLGACPAPVLLGLFPSFWAVGRKGSTPPALPTVVLGTAERDHMMKKIDWEAGRFEVIERRGRRLVSSEPLLEGWNARRWLTWPLLPRHRQLRARKILERAATVLVEAKRKPFAIDDRMRWLEQAERGLNSLDPAGALRDTLRRALDALPALPCVQEHGDLTLGNFVVVGRKLVAVDPPAVAGFGPPGMDACAIAFDVISALAGDKQLDLRTTLRDIASPDPALGSFLATFLETRDALLASRLMLLAVLRHAVERRPWPGTPEFLAAAADGRLTALLRASDFAASEDEAGFSGFA